MAVVIHWKPVENAAKINLYQSPQRFTYADIGVRGDITKTELANSAVNKEVAIARNTVNFFCVSGVDSNDLELFGEIFAMGNFPNSGPGPSTLKRGTWEFGFFGEVPAEELMTNGQLGSLLSKAGVTVDNISSGNKINFWNKCIVNGKIIFFPNVFIYEMPPNGDKPTLLAQRKLTLDPGFPGAPILNKDGNDYKFRLPSLSRTNPAGQLPISNISASEEYLSTEAGMLMALSMGYQKVSRLATLASNPGAFNVWDDLNDTSYNASASIAYAGTAHYTAKTNNATWQLVLIGLRDSVGPVVTAQNWYYSSSSSFNTFNVCPVLELVF